MAQFSEHANLRHSWYALATEVELAAGPVGRTLLGEAVVLYRDPNGAVVAAPDRCPHRQAPLSAGRVNNGILSCCYHGWEFGAEGKCVNIPSASDDQSIPRKGHLVPFSARLAYGLVWVCLDEPKFDLPTIPAEDDASFRRINSPVQLWQASATRMVDNFLDIAHFPWVHTGTFGNNQTTEVPRIELAMLSDEFYGYAYDVVADNPPAAELTSGQTEGAVERSMTTGFQLPFHIRSTIRYTTGSEHILLLLSAPVDDVNTHFTFVVWRNDDFRVSAEDIIAFDRAIGQEDKQMLEKIPGALPLGNGELASTPSDKASTAWRLRFAELVGLNVTETK